MINEFRPMNHLTSLQNLICTIGNLPTSYALSLSYEEQIWWLCDFLEKKVFPAIEENTEITEETQQAFIELQNYVRDYFNNLDVQDEINNKLDDMAEQGTLQEIINAYLQSNCLWVFNNVNEMKNATNLINGSKCKTLGYYSANDGGNAIYLIRNKTENDVDNGGSIHFINNNNLVAEIIATNSINIKQFGAIEDGLTDDLLYFQRAIDYIDSSNNINTLILNKNKNYLITDKIEFTSTNIIGNNATIKYSLEPSSNLPIYVSGNNFKIENLNVDLGNRSYLASTMRLQNCNNVEIINGNYSHSIDAYSNNKNIKFLNLISPFGVMVRELFDNTTENITIENCIIDRPANPDECCWVVSSHGIIQNVKFINCDFRHRGNSDNCLAVSAYYENSITDNIIFENCKFNFNATGYYAMHISGSSNANKGTTKNVIFNFCDFEINCGENNRIILENEDGNVLFNSCNINVNNSDYYGFKRANIRNSDVEIDCKKYSFLLCKLLNNKITETRSQYFSAGENLIDNCDITCNGLINIINTNLYGTDNNTLIKNSKIDVTSETLFQVNNNTGNITVENSKINNISNGTVFSINNASDTCEMSLKNVDLSSEYNKLSNYNGYGVINVTNLTHNNKNIAVSINDIDANTRKALALNTIILAPIDVGLFYRKISDGNLTSNWHLYGEL